MQATQAVKTHFDLHEVVVLSGFTKHMLDYLAREEILVPQGARGRGVRRCYSYTDVVLLRALHGICVSKGKIRHLKQALAAFRASHGPILPGERVDTKLIVLDGDLYEAETATAVRRLRDGQLGFSFFVDLWEVTDQLAACVVANEGSKAFELKAEIAQQAEAVRQKNWTAVRSRREAA